MADHVLTVRSVLIRPGEKLGDGGATEYRQVTAQFSVPLNGSETGWALPYSVGTVFNGGSFLFSGPNIPNLILAAEARARAELVEELRKLSLDEIAEFLRERDDPDVPA